MKVSAKRAVLEFASIVVAVVLAMSLTEMRQNYLNKKLAQKSLANILEEVRDNRQELLNDSTKIASDLAFMSQWIKDVKEERKPEDFSADFTFSFLSRTALEVAKVNQSLTYLSNEDNMEIAEVYATQEFYSEQGAKLFDVMGNMVGSLTNPNVEDMLPHVVGLRFYLVLVFNTVKAYLAETRELLENHGVAVD